MVEMMADGVEADMNFRDAATPEIRRREMMEGQRTGHEWTRCEVRVMVTLPSWSQKSVFMIWFIMSLSSTPQTAESSRKITDTISVRVLIQEIKVKTKRTKRAISPTQDPAVRAVRRVYQWAISSTLPPGFVVFCFVHHFP